MSDIVDPAPLARIVSGTSSILNSTTLVFGITLPSVSKCAAWPSQPDHHVIVATVTASHIAVCRVRLITQAILLQIHPAQPNDSLGGCLGLDHNAALFVGRGCFHGRDHAVDGVAHINQDVVVVAAARSVSY